MICQIQQNGVTYAFDAQSAKSIAIKVRFDDQQPNHFGAEIATRQPLVAGGFIGDTTKGGSCNVDQITMVPHCNGTHTETISHIVHQSFPVGDLIADALSLCRDISVHCVAGDATPDQYLPDLQASDRVIDLACLQQQISAMQLHELQALVIRTLPNSTSKQCQRYDEHHQPVFFTHQAISWLAASNLKHLLVDIPSIDKMYDQGLLSNHHLYWQVEPSARWINDASQTDRTITEMIYVDDDIRDGLYCLNLQIPAFGLDAAPSRPLLYPLIHTTQSTKTTTHQDQP